LCGGGVSGRRGARRRQLGRRNAVAITWRAARKISTWSIFEDPRLRSSKMIGISRIWKPAWWTRQTISSRNA
jgi:hypothetical protein